MAIVLSCSSAESVRNAICALIHSDLIAEAREVWGNFLENPEHATRTFYVKVVTAATTGIFYNETPLTNARMHVVTWRSLTQQTPFLRMAKLTQFS